MQLIPKNQKTLKDLATWAKVHAQQLENIMEEQNFDIVRITRRLEQLEADCRQFRNYLDLIKRS